MNQLKRFLLLGTCILISLNASAQKVDYSVVSVPEEASLKLQKLSSDNDMVAMPLVRRNSSGVEWSSGRIIDVSPNDNALAFISMRDKMTNIYLKEADKPGSSVKRTNRTAIMDLSFSPDGKTLLFSENIGKNRQLFQTDARQGFSCRQITSGSIDLNPVYSRLMTKIFFSRKESQGYSIWSYDVNEKYLSSYSNGVNSIAISENWILCSRTNTAGKSEIWILDLEHGTEECILSDPKISFSSPALSPDRKKIAVVGGSALPYKERSYWNTDIYTCNIDGSDLQQITYHAADDLCPVWSPDGRYLYFVSQRGSENACANIWRITLVQ